MVDWNGVIYTYAHNYQGDIIGILDSTGAAVVKYYYDAWGRQYKAEGTLKDSLGKLNPFRYRGYVYDEETGLYYLRSRYYNPEWGRFISSDVLLGHVGALRSHNLFAYCSNMPMGNADPDGMDWALAPEAYGPEYGVPTIGLQSPGWVSSLWGYIAALFSKSEPIAVPNVGTQSIPKSTVKPSPSPSPSPTPAPTLNPNRKYYIAVAFFEYSPIPISEALTLNEVLERIHDVDDWLPVYNELLAAFGAKETPVAYGVYTRYKSDAEALASWFGSGAMSVHEPHGEQMLPHIKTSLGSRNREELHFWFGVYI